MHRLLIPVFAALALAACASTPSYGPAATANASGYSETRVENDRYFVTYRAKSGADARLIEDYALLRAAEIAIDQGRDWFIVDRRTTDASENASSGPRIGIGVGGANYGGRTSSGASVGVGLSFPIGGGSGPRATSATLEVRLGSGPKPDDANAYEARPVAASLRQRLVAGQ